MRKHVSSQHSHGKSVPWHAGMVLFALAICPWTSVFTLTVSAAETPSPGDVERRCRTALKRVKVACVSVGGGSGVIISPDGHVLTVAHVVGDKRFLQVELDDGRKAFAIPVGADRTADVALLKIVIPTDTFENVNPESLAPCETEWPHAELASRAPGTGAFCFLMGHPGARMAERPAQFRLGRITHLHVSGPFIDADCTIQPGDSGCGLFDLEGRVVGIGIHATPYPGSNTFTRIEAFHKGRERIAAGQIWGEQPAHDQLLADTAQDEAAAILRREYEKLKGTDYRPVLDSYIDTHAPQMNEMPSLTPLVLAGALDYRAMAAIRNVPCGFGMQDPKLVGQWPVDDTPHTKPVRVFAEPSLRSFGLPVSRRHLIVKWNLFHDVKSLNVQVAEELKLASFVNGNVGWDLALFDLGADLLTPVKFSEAVISQAQALASPNADGHLVWGFTCDGPREVKRMLPIGHFYNANFISRFRAPYQRATHHGLPLTNRDAGRPLYNLNGACVGMHVARFSRSSSLLIAGADIDAVYRQWLREGPQPEKAYPRRDVANQKTVVLRRKVSENITLSEVAFMISLYLNENGKLPSSLDALDEGEMKRIFESNKRLGIRMIYLGNSVKGTELEDLSAIPVLITPSSQGKHTVAFADGKVKAVATDALQVQLKKLNITMPPSAMPVEPK